MTDLLSYPLRSPFAGARRPRPTVAWRVCAMALLVFAVTAPVGAEQAGSQSTPMTDADRRTVFEQAIADFEAAAAMKNHASPQARELYESARAGFHALVDSGVQNGRLYYNLANAYLRLGRIGHAIVNYRRALQLLPGDPQTLRNLDAARKLCEVRFQKPASSAMIETLFFWHYGTSRAARLHFALAAYAVFWVLALAARFLPRRIPSVTWLTVVVAVLCLAAGASVAWESTRGQSAVGVLIADDVVVRKGNGAYYEPRFEQALPQGVEFEIVESRPDVEGQTWYLVRLPDGKEGWLRADQAEKV